MPNGSYATPAPNQWKRYNSKDLKTRRVQELVELDNKTLDKNAVNAQKEVLSKRLKNWDQTSRAADSGPQAEPGMDFPSKIKLEENWMSGKSSFNGLEGMNAYTSLFFSLMNQYKRGELNMQAMQEQMEKASPNSFASERETATMTDIEHGVFKSVTNSPWKANELGSTVGEALRELEQRVQKASNQLEHDMTHGDNTRTEEDMIVYRGMILNPGTKIDNRNASFLSTTLHAGVAKGFAKLGKRAVEGDRHHFTAKLPKGTFAQYAAPISQYQKEDEMVLAPGMKFREYCHQTIRHDLSDAKGSFQQDAIHHYGEYGRDYLALTRKGKPMMPPIPQSKSIDTKGLSKQDSTPQNDEYGSMISPLTQEERPMMPLIPQHKSKGLRALFDKIKKKFRGSSGDLPQDTLRDERDERDDRYNRDDRDRNSEIYHDDR